VTCCSASGIAAAPALLAVETAVSAQPTGVRDPREAYPKPPFPAATAEEVPRRHVKEKGSEVSRVPQVRHQHRGDGARLQQRKDGLMRKLAGE
jgi:hypothetical protein